MYFLSTLWTTTCVCVFVSALTIEKDKCKAKFSELPSSLQVI